MMKGQLPVPGESSKKVHPQEKNNIFCIRIKRRVLRKLRKPTQKQKVLLPKVLASKANPIKMPNQIYKQTKKLTLIKRLIN